MQMKGEKKERQLSSGGVEGEGGGGGGGKIKNVKKRTVSEMETVKKWRRAAQNESGNEREEEDH
jgi:hypothetical protein